MAIRAIKTVIPTTLPLRLRVHADLLLAVLGSNAEMASEMRHKITRELAECEGELPEELKYYPLLVEEAKKLIRS
jgi:hypothetical protein